MLQKTGEITQYALISMFFVLPGVLLGPLAGTLIDRWDRRKAMLISDLGAGLSTLSIGIVYLLGGLQVWYIYVAVFINGAFGSLRMPSMQAAMTQMIPHKNLGRASGMMEIVQIGQFLIAPAVAGGLMGKIGLAGVIMIDFTSILFAITILLFVRIPRAEATTEGQAGSGSMLQEMFYGWKYILARPGLAALMLLFAASSFTTEGWASVASGFSLYAGYFLPAESLWIGNLFALLLIGGLSAINYFGIKPGARTINFFTVGKLLSLFIFIAVGVFFIHGNDSPVSIWEREIPPAVHGGNFSAAIIMALYAYTGFEFIAVPAGEMRHPRRDIPRVLVFLLMFVTGLYVTIQIVAAGTFPALASSDKPLADAAQYFMGKTGGILIGVGLVALDPELLPGAWRNLTADEVAGLADCAAPAGA